MFQEQNESEELSLISLAAVENIAMNIHISFPIFTPINTNLKIWHNKLHINENCNTQSRYCKHKSEPQTIANKNRTTS
jgi:hypothetical protein